LIDKIIPTLLDIWGEAIRIDLVTCFAGAPAGINGTVYRVTDYVTPETRKALVRELTANGYQTLGIICSAEPIMSKWKWLLVARVPAMVFILNENGDYVWLDRPHAAVLWEFVRLRTGLAGAGAARTLIRLALFPFSLAYLILYATSVHARRALRLISS
jgi:hypothetical protein